MDVLLAAETVVVLVHFCLGQIRFILWLAKNRVGLQKLNDLESECQTVSKLDLYAFTFGISASLHRLISNIKSLISDPGCE